MTININLKIVCSVFHINARGEIIGNLFPDGIILKVSSTQYEEVQYADSAFGW